MHAGTRDDTYFADENNKNWVAKSSLWAQFLSTACLGTIHKNDEGIDQVLNKFVKNSDDKFQAGGKLYAIGLALAGSKDQNRIANITEVINSCANQPKKEPQVHGACLGLGLIGYASADYSLVELLKTLFITDKATQGEAAGYAMGLIMTGKIDDELMN